MAIGTAGVPAQRRPEHKLRRHIAWPCSMTRLSFTAQRRPEHKLRRHPRTRRQSGTSGRPALNEGRSINSGDTSQVDRRRARRPERAQRRPEHKLRRHTRERVCRPARTLDAQRRPEHKLRRHPRPSACSRSILSLPAQRRPEHKLRRHLGRSFHASPPVRPAQRRPEHKLRRHIDVRCAPW